MYEYWKPNLKRNKLIRKYRSVIPDWVTWWFIASLITLLILTSCKPTERIITNTEYKDRVEYRDRLQRDSIYVQDSIHIREKGDTIWIETFKFKYVDKLLRDTVSIADTVRTETVNTEYVRTNVIYWYQKYPMYLGYLAIILLAVYVGLKLKKIWL